MAPIEVRPVTQADVEAVAAGRWDVVRTVGQDCCAPAGEEDPRGPRPAVVAELGRRGVLDDGVPWPRELFELADEWERVCRVLGLTLAAAKAGRPAEDLQQRERRALGVDAAARWTLGLSPLAPLNGEPAWVTGAAIRRELAIADAVIPARAPGWEFATGVVGWLLWVTGAEDKMWDYQL